MKKILLAIFFSFYSMLSFANYSSNEISINSAQTFAYNENESPKSNKPHFVHPLEFKDTAEERENVIAYIEMTVKESLDFLGIKSVSMQRDMEKAELRDFKALTKAENREILDNVIDQLSFIGINTYSMIRASYEQELLSLDDELTW